MIGRGASVLHMKVLCQSHFALEACHTLKIIKKMLNIMIVEISKQRFI